jgi:hypothetical protein
MLQKITQNRSSAITIVEAAIILAILGASIVAIVLFRFTMNTSMASSSIQKMMDRTLAFKVFASSYDCIPGDCLDADNKVQSNSYMNGNGNGVINVYGRISEKNEVAFIEEHITRSRLFRKTLSYHNLDYRKIDLQKLLQGGRVPSSYISTISSGKHFYNILGGFSQNNASNPDVLNFTPIPSRILSIIDAKADDANSETGEIRCYTEQYTVEDDVVTLPKPAKNYEEDCVLSFNILFNSESYTAKNDINS